MKLTAKQILTLDELSADKEAIDKTLVVALNYHANIRNGIIKVDKAFWEDLAEVHGLDIENVKYKLVHKYGAVYIEEVKDSEDE